jgi:4-amino-4-deoxy-L-arabinose transferase-like glycosyltransferase
MKPTGHNRWQLFLLIFIAVLPLMILRDFTPDNELKYLSIADEAIENGNVFAFYNHGVPYADKPPLYLWIVITGKLIFGEHVMFFLSLFSIIPALIIAAVMDKWVRNELPKEGAQSAVLILFSSAFYLACSIVLRMDMLMTMFITLAIYTL